jgi:hypothetical protein
VTDAGGAALDVTTDADCLAAWTRLDESTLKTLYSALIGTEGGKRLRPANAVLAG